MDQHDRILLKLDAAVLAEEFSARTGLSAPEVFKWRKRYQEHGLAGLSDRPRLGQPRKLTEDKVREIPALTTRRIPTEAWPAAASVGRTAPGLPQSLVN